MKKILYILTAILIAGSVCSCDYLDKRPEEDLNMDDVWASYLYTERFVNAIYPHLQRMGFADTNDTDRNPFVGGCDEMEVTFGSAFSHTINSGAWNALTIGNIRTWDICYKAIRKANLVIANIDKVPATDDQRNNLLGQCYFLRAWFHAELLRCFGPIILIDRPVETGAVWTSYKRAPYQQCVQFIVDDCDRASAPGMLKAKYSSEETSLHGRANAAAAKALKARVLLYAASDLFNGNPDYADVTDRDGVRLFPDRDDNRWALAAKAAKECIDYCLNNGYDLNRDADPMKAYQDVFINQWNNEILFARINAGWHHNVRCSEPRHNKGYTILCPTQEQVDAYQMADGSVPITGYQADQITPIIDPSSGYVETGYTDAAHPQGYYPAGVRMMYVNREPRFYASINFAGKLWNGVQCSFWSTGVDGTTNQQGDYCKTGYLMRKGAVLNVNYDRGGPQTTTILLRLGEVYLNYAEALNEATIRNITVEGCPASDAAAYVNLIRSRGGIPALPTMSPDELRERIRRERRVELAFESHRFFDVRRWKIAAQTESKIITRMDITKGTGLQDDSYYVRNKVEDRIFESKHYLLPIPQGEIDKNRNIIQNKDWLATQN